MEAQVALALPADIATMQSLLTSPDAPLSDVDVMRAWEADFSLFSHAALLSESLAQDTLRISAPLADPLHRPAPLGAAALATRAELLESLRNLQTQIQTGLAARVARMSFKPRLYRLAARLSLADAEVRAFIFIVLTCTGLDGPPTDERLQTARPRSELFTCRQFARMAGHELLHFLSPARAHFAQGLLEVDEEFAAMYTENRFRAPREVLKAVYGCTLTLDEAMTLGNSHLAAVLDEEPGSIAPPEPPAPDVPLAGGVLANVRSPSDAARAADAEDVLAGMPKGLAPSVRDRSTDNSAVLELLSELRLDGAEEPETCEPADAAEPGTDTTDTPEAEGAAVEAEAYADDMDYLKDGFDVVQESCKVYNFREKNSEEDRYTNTKRPVEALQREADAKLRKASALFSRRLGKSRAVEAFVPRLELLVEKLKLAHFERMIILTLVGAVLSQSIRKTLRSDPSLGYENGITVGKLLRMHCSGDLRQEIKSRSYFYRNATLVRSGIITIDVPYNMAYSDLGDFCCELDHMVLDYVAGLQTELEEIMDSARCYTPNIDMDSVILPTKMKQLVLQRTENFDTFRRLRKELGFDDIVRYGKGLTLFFHGKSGTGKTLFANALASHLDKKLLVVDFNSLNNSKQSNADAYRIVFREAKIHGAIVFIDECDELFESRERGGKGAVTVALREMETFDGIMILATNRPQMLDEAMHRRIALSLMFEPPDAKHRLAIWQKHIPKDLRLGKDVDLKALAIEFELTGGFIKNAVFQALASAVSRVKRELQANGVNGGDVKAGTTTATTKAKEREKEKALAVKADDVIIMMSELRQACRLQARGDLKRTKLERRVIPVCGLDKLVARTEAMEILQNVVSVEKVRAVMSTRFGFKDRQSRSNCVLIFGGSGCGKSFAASCLGFETGRPLQRLAASELHGSREGSSQIGDVFAQAAVAGAVVVVEHAEQLLVQTAQAESTASPGLELLFHMQSFDGLVVLCCTTAEEALEAGWPLHLPLPSRVASLLSYIVVLKKPNRAERLRLWQQLIPSETPLHKEVAAGLDKVAGEFEFSGARISSCIRRAAAATAMRRNRASLVGDGDAEEEEEGVRLHDIEEACEAEAKVRATAEGHLGWMKDMFV